MAANFPGYPIAVGAKKMAVHPNGHAGPASYTQVTTGPLAGGDTVYASDFGLKYIESLDGGITADGLYRVEVIMPVSGPATSVTLRWTVVATGAQVAGAVNLSASIVNLIAVGL